MLNDNFLFRNTEVYRLDHQYPNKAAKDKPVAVLYGQIGSSNVYQFHSKLKSLADADEIIYILRHFIKDNKGPKVRLSGDYFI